MIYCSLSVDTVSPQFKMANQRRRQRLSCESTTTSSCTFFLSFFILTQILSPATIDCTSINTIAGPAHVPYLKSRFNKLRHVTLKDDAFCEAYQEFRDGNCIAKLTDCSPLDEEQVLKMRQVLCGPRFNGKLILSTFFCKQALVFVNKPFCFLAS